MIDYNKGFILSSVLAIVASLVLFILLLLKRRNNDEFGNIFVFLFFISITGLGVFSFIYSISNSVANYQLLKQKFGNEHFITENVLLRINSLLIGWKIFKGLFFTVAELFDLPIKYLRKQREFRGNHFSDDTSFLELHVRNLSQLGIYLASILTIYYFQSFENQHDVKYTILNFIVFFIIDDWNVINDYAYELKGRILSYQSLKIDFCNLLIFIFTIALLWKEIKLISVFGTILILSATVIRYFNMNQRSNY